MNGRTPRRGGSVPLLDLQLFLICLLLALGLMLLTSYVVITSFPKASISGTTTTIRSVETNGSDKTPSEGVYSIHQVKETTSKRLGTHQTSITEDRNKKTAAIADAAVVGVTNKQQPRATIAYAISLTGCGSEPLADGGAVLKQSIHSSSIHNPSSGSMYSYQLYAIVHPSATECSQQLSDIGYTILVKDTPVAVSDIRGDFLREHVPQNGCCGEKEFIKLHAYTLTNHPIVVHLDLDTMILQPMDELFDAMLYDETTDVGWKAREGLPSFKTPIMPKQIDAFFTRDYNMHQAHQVEALVQGGFLVLRPSVDTYKELREVIAQGDFRPNGGWGGKGYKGCGAMTFQGLIPYYYDQLHPGTAVELNRCIYNQMSDNPRDQRTVNDVVQGKCRDGREDCEDCRSADFLTIKTVHFTLCRKPWLCLPHDIDELKHRLCRKLHHEWFRLRKDLEDKLLAANPGMTSVATGTFQKDHFYGLCKHSGGNGYIPMVLPVAGIKEIES